MQDPENSEVIRNIPLIPLRDLVVFPATLVPFIVGPALVHPGPGEGRREGQDDLPRGPDGRVHRQSRPQGYLFHGGDGEDHPDGQDRREEHEGHRRGQEPGPDRRVPQHLPVLSDPGQGPQGGRGPDPGRQGAPEAGPVALRGIPEAQPERQPRFHHPRPPGEHGRPDRRYHRLPPLPAARRKAEPARDDQQPGAPEAPELRPRERDPQDPFGLPARRPEAGPPPAAPQGRGLAEGLPARSGRRPQGGPAQRGRGAAAEGGRGQDASGRRGKGVQGDRAAGSHAAHVRRGDGQPELPRLAPLPALEQEDPGKKGPQGSRDHPQRGPLRPGKGQGEDPRIPVDPPAGQEPERGHPRLSRAAGSGQELPGQVHRPGDGTEVRPPVPGRRPGRGRDPRPPQDLHRGLSRADHPDDQEGRDEEPRLPPRRGRQDEHGLPGRPRLGPHGGPRPRAEQHVPRPLHRHGFRPLPGHVHRDGQHARPDPEAAHRPDGDHPHPRLHRGGEARDRQAVPPAQTDEVPRPGGRREPQVHGPGHAQAHPRIHAGGRRPEPGAGDHDGLPEGRQEGRPRGQGRTRKRSPRRTSRAISASPSSAARRSTPRTRSASPSAWPGRNSAARC